MKTTRPVGRPPGKRFDKKTAFDLEQSTYDRIATLAEADGIAVATWIRRCVERAVSRRNVVGYIQRESKP